MKPECERDSYNAVRRHQEHRTEPQSSIARAQSSIAHESNLGLAAKGPRSPVDGIGPDREVRISVFNSTNNVSVSEF